MSGPAGNRSKAKYPTAKSKERLKVIGEIRIEPMFGATVVIATANLGEIVIAKVGLLSDDASKRFEELDNSKYSVEATGVVVTLCTERQIKKGTAYCRVFDESKPIRIHVTDLFRK